MSFYSLATWTNWELILIFLYRWDEYEKGLAYVLYITDPRSVPADIRYSYEKAFQLAYFKEAAWVPHPNIWNTYYAKSLQANNWCSKS